MKADLSRDTFDPTHHFLRVVMQQGRVQVDADWNEQAAILIHRLQVLARDLIGPAGAPVDAPGFQVAVNGTDLLIRPGRFYVDGILCELEPNLPPDPDRGAGREDWLSYFSQPDHPLELEALPAAGWVYLDVWERHLTPIEEPGIREVALGGPDTAGRTKVVWQVKIATKDAQGAPIPAGAACPDDDAWQALVRTLQPAPEDRGTLAARADQQVDLTKPCVTPPSVGYRGPENQLYRVEIVRSGAAAGAGGGGGGGGGGAGGGEDEEGDGVARFVWSRENGSVVSSWDRSGDELALADLPRDTRLGFEPGQWIELTDDAHELAGQAGTFVKLTGVEAEVLTVDPATATGGTDPDEFAANPKIRRWDSPGLRRVEVPATNDGWLDLEQGVQVRFSATGTYRAGDYWLIPARVLEGVEWPIDGPGAPVARGPDGIEHHYALLGTLGGGDCRRVFGPVPAAPV